MLFNVNLPHSSQCSTIGIIKAMVYAILSGMVNIKDPLLPIEKSSPCSSGSGFSFWLSPWSYTIYPMPYNHK